MHHATAPVTVATLAVVLALVSFPTGAVAQTDCLDQSYLPVPQTNGLEVTANQPVTQTFTVGLTGQLTRIELAQLQQFRGVPTAPLQVDLVTTDPAGVPTTTVLAGVTLQPAQVPAARGPVLVDVRAFNVQVVAGQVLGLALSSAAAPSTQTYAWWGEAPGGSYANGQVFIRQNVALPAWDLAFQTFVAPVATWTNYGQGFAGTSGVPTFTSAMPPRLGVAANLTIGGYAPGVVLGAIWFGVARNAQPTPFGGTALVQPAGAVAVFLPPGTSATPLLIPNDARFCGMVVDFQAVLLDAGAAQGIAFTPGLEFVVGF